MEACRRSRHSQPLQSILHPVNRVKVRRQQLSSPSFSSSSLSKLERLPALTLQPALIFKACLLKHRKGPYFEKEVPHLRLSWPRGLATNPGFAANPFVMFGKDSTPLWASVSPSMKKLDKMVSGMLSNPHVHGIAGLLDH